MGNQLRPSLASVGEQPLQALDDSGVEIAAGRAQQRRIGGVLYQDVLEQEIGIRRLAPAKHGPALMSRRSAASSSAWSLRATAASISNENSRPMAAPICATSLAGP